MSDCVDLRAAQEMLNAKYGVNTVRVDRGGILNGVLLGDGLMDEVVSLLIYSCLVGGVTQASMYKAPNLNLTEGMIPLKLTLMGAQGDDLVWLRYEVVT